MNSSPHLALVATAAFALVVTSGCRDEAGAKMASATLPLARCTVAGYGHPAE